MKNKFLALMFFTTLHNSYSIITLPLFEPKPVLDLVKKYLPENPTIIDAGAYIGTESKLMANYWPKGNIYAFEPVPEIFNNLKLNIYKVPNIQIFELALADTNGKKELYISEEVNSPGIPSQSSSLRPPKEHLKYSTTLFPKKIKVNTITIDSWAQKNNIKKIDFLWLDLQGSELEILKAAPNIVNNASAIFLEVEFIEAYENQATFEELKKWIEKKGYTWIAKDFKAPMERVNENFICWFGNVLFVKNELIQNEPK